MAKYFVVISYDLRTPPGLHARFIEEMKREKWQFEYSNRPLPNTTCWASFAADVSKDEAVRVAQSDLKMVENHLKSVDPKFCIESSFILAYPKDDSKVEVN